MGEHKGQSMARIYKVMVDLRAGIDGAEPISRTLLVEAENPAQARAHVTRKLVTIEVASQRDVYDGAVGGIQIENATAQASVEG